MSLSTGENDDDHVSNAEDIDLFAEPEGWVPPEKPCTFQSYTVEVETAAGEVEPRDIKLRLVGSSPLWVSRCSCGENELNTIEDGAACGCIMVVCYMNYSS